VKIGRTSRSRWLCGAAVLIGAASLGACEPAAERSGESASSRAGGARAAGALRVAATTPALAWLVEGIGGDAVTVERLGAEALDPAWSPAADEILRLSEADLIVARGRRIETWIETASLPPSRLVETTAGLELLEREGPTHSHGAEGEHSHRTVDPATPLDPELFAAQAGRVRDALVRVAGAGADRDRIASVAAELAAELDELSAELRAVGEEWARRGAGACVAPAGRLDYACRALGLPHASSTADRSPPLTLVLWPLGTPDPPMAADTRVVPLDPLELPLAGGADADFDYLGRQRANLERLRAAAAGAGSAEAR
jgi:zinc transport system substrate-binding protein